MQKLKILLYLDAFNDKVYLNSAYVDFFSLFGEVIMVLPNNDLERMISLGDVLALPGGADVDPLRYGEAPWNVTRTNPNFEFLDKNLLTPWLATGKPIIGICRGLQTLNVALGGSLYQNIFGHMQEKNRDVTQQELYTDIPGYHIHRVNSFHHQAVKKLAPGFDVIGWTTAFKSCPSLSQKRAQPDGRHIYVENKNVGIKKDSSYVNGVNSVNLYFSFPEIIKHNTQPYIAFQYHPEEFFCPLAITLITETLNAYYENEEDNDIQENEGIIKTISE